MTISAEVPDVSNFITKNVNNLTYYTLKTNTGSLIDLEINQSTYVVTLHLKDQDGNTISTDTIDLPLENVVVSGSYDSINKKIVLTLQNGNTVDIPVGDLIAGLQSEITSSNKLASDLVDDSNSGHKFTSTSEKQTWNNKYDKPSGGIPKTDLSSNVQTSLGKADTAIQSSDLVDYATKTEVQEVSTKIVGSGESLLINNTEQAILNLDLKGNTSQTGTPTPDNPIDINVVTGNNDIHIIGLNYFDGNVESGYYDTSTGEKISGSFYRNANPILVEPNTTYKFSINGVNKAINVLEYKKDMSYIGYMGGTSIPAPDSFTTSSETKYINIYRGTGDGDELWQIEKNSVKTAYKPYVSQIYPINLGSIELCKIGDYQDRIYKDNGTWYLHKEIGKVVLNGSEGWNNPNSYQGIYQMQTAKTDVMYVSDTITRTLSNYFKGTWWNSSWTRDNSIVLGNGLIRIMTSDYTTTDAFKTWLSTHNTIVYYVLATPTTTEITDTTLISQLEAFKTAQSYNEVTNVIQKNDKKPFTLDCKTFKNVPLMTSQIINDSNYVTNSDIPTKTSDLTNDSNFVTNTDYATSTTGGVVRVYSSDGFSMNNGVLIGSTKTYQQYNDGGNWMMLCKGTLENAITGKELTNKNDLQNISINTNSPMPNFDGMIPLGIYEFDVTDTSYHPIYTLPNTGLSFTNFRATVGYRITVTGTDIEQIVDIIDEWHNPASYPLTTAINRTLSTSSATTGFRYLRAVYPTSTYINDTDYPLGQEIACYNANARHFKIEVFRQPSNITWKSTADTSIYVDSTHNGNSSATVYSTRGWIYRSPASFVASSASSATYASGYEPATVGVGSLKTGAAAISAAHIAYLADDNLVYDISDTTKNMAPGFTKIGLITNAVAKKTAISQTYFRSATPLSSTNLGTISHDTLALGKRMFLRCTMDANGNIHSDNYIATTMGAGYTWMPIGVATSSSAGYMDTRSQHFYTLDANGKLTHIDGLEIAANS